MTHSDGASMAEFVALCERLVREVEVDGIHVASTGNAYTVAKKALAVLAAPNDHRYERALRAILDVHLDTTLGVTVDRAISKARQEMRAIAKEVLGVES